MARQNDEFLRGFAAALGTLVRCFDQPTMAADIMQSNAVTLDDLRAAKTQPFDFAPLRKAWRERPRKPRPRKGAKR